MAIAPPRRRRTPPMCRESADESTRWYGLSPVSYAGGAGVAQRRAVRGNEPAPSILVLRQFTVRTHVRDSVRVSTERRGSFHAARVPVVSDTATAEARPFVPSDRRSELLDRLEEVILSQGFVGLTLDELAARLRCSKSTLYLVAPSKEQLVVQVARHFFSRAAARIEAAVAEAPTPPKRLKIYLTSVGREMSRGSTTFHEQMASHPITSELYRRNSQIAADRVRQLIHEGVQDGCFQVADAQFAGHFAATVMEAIHLDGDAIASRRATTDAYRKLTDLILLGVTGRRSRR